MTQDTQHPRAVLAACILGSSLAFIDGSVVNVALTAIGRELSGTPADLSWIITGYLLLLSATIMLGGGLGDHYGRRRIFIIGVAMFLASSLLCAIAPNMLALHVGRIVQGLGAGLLMPNSLAILGTSFSGEAKGRAIGTWAGSGALTAAIGPLLGGWLIDAVSWRAVFYINLPLGGLALFLAWRYVGACRATDVTRRLDWLGATLVTLGLATLTWGLIDAAQPQHDPRAVWAALGTGAVLLVSFLMLQLRRGEDALMPLHLMRGRTFTGVTLLTFMQYAALGGLIVILPFMMTHIRGANALEAGAALLPVPVIIGLFSRRMGRIVARTGGRLPLAAGACLVGIGMALFTRVGAEAVPYWQDILPACLFIAIGMVFTAAPLTTTVIGAVDARHTGIASGFNSAVARIGSLVATALLAFVMADADEPARFIAGFHMAAIIGAGLSFASSLAALLLIERRKD